MNQIVKLESVEDKIIEIKGEKVILDSDVAALYGVKKDINKAVKNNQDKFPEGYILELSKQEFEKLRRKFSTAKFSMTRVTPKAFTEKGLYMLATIIKSPKAAQTTLDIVETYARIRDLSKSMSRLSTADKAEQKSIMEKAADVLGDILDNAMETTGSETTLESNLAV